MESKEIKRGRKPKYGVRFDGYIFVPPGSLMYAIKKFDAAGIKVNFVRDGHQFRMWVEE